MVQLWIRPEWTVPSIGSCLDLFACGGALGVEGRISLKPLRVSSSHSCCPSRLNGTRFVSGSLSGIERSVDFFANHGSNIALDIVRLAVSQADEIRKRADADAFKIYDVLQGKDVARFVAMCAFSSTDQLAKVNEDAKAIIESAGATVVTALPHAREALGLSSSDLVL